MRFLDTMSLHIMCSGFTHAQRMQYQAFEKGSLARSNDKDEISQEDDLDEQYLSMLLANEKDKDVKAYAKMRHMKVRILMDSIGESYVFRRMTLLSKSILSTEYFSSVKVVNSSTRFPPSPSFRMI